jgi:hypothetical protein
LSSVNHARCEYMQGYVNPDPPDLDPGSVIQAEQKHSLI